MPFAVNCDQDKGMQLVDGNKIAQDVLVEIQRAISELKESGTPTLAFIRVGEDPASVSYVRKKEKIAAQVGIESRTQVFPNDVSREELLTYIDQLNDNPDVHGILVQAPLPKHLSETEVFNRVSPTKDVDGFNVQNIGKLCQEDETGFIACTPAGIVELVKRSKIETQGKHVVVVGRSLIVGKPAALLFIKKGLGGNATVTICHSQTQNLPDITKQADILIAATGRPCFITKDMIKQGAAVIDVGINRVPDETKKSGYRLVGDVDFDEVSPICSRITPVPGGVGPMTVAMLMNNTLKSFQAHAAIEA